MPVPVFNTYRSVPPRTARSQANLRCVKQVDGDRFDVAAFGRPVFVAEPADRVT